MYVAMQYFVFMEAIVSWLINGENISYVWNPCCLLHFPFLWARVRMGHVPPGFARNPMMLKRLGSGSLQTSLGVHNPNPMKIEEFLLKLLMKIHQFGFLERKL